MFPTLPFGFRGAGKSGPLTITKVAFPGWEPTTPVNGIALGTGSSDLFALVVAEVEGADVTSINNALTSVSLGGVSLTKVFDVNDAAHYRMSHWLGRIPAGGTVSLVHNFNVGIADATFEVLKITGSDTTHFKNGLMAGASHSAGLNMSAGDVMHFYQQGTQTSSSFTGGTQTSVYNTGTNYRHFGTYAAAAAETPHIVTGNAGTDYFMAMAVYGR